MRREHMVERNGRAFCLYAGLLDLAHQAGLKSIRTELVQIPSEANNRVAICTATVVLEKDGIERTFNGIGDAAPNNVAPAMLSCLIRMAETRSKARALRDAVNIGEAAFEELMDDDAQDGSPERGYAAVPFTRRPARTTAAPASTAARQPAAPAKSPKQESNPNGPATETQIEAVRSLCRRQSKDADTAAKDKFGVDCVGNLSQVQASELIKSLNSTTRTAA